MTLFASRYRLSWCACAALVLLRVAIGWHFLHEGLAKIESHRKGTRPFSAEGYLANSSGPLRDWFRSQLDDPDGLGRLEPATLAGRWNELLHELDARYSLTADQNASALEKIRQLTGSRDEYFRDPRVQAKIAQYRDALDEVAKLEQEERQLGFLHAGERAAERRRERGLAKLRDELAAPIDGWTTALREHVLKQLTPEQKAGDSADQPGKLAAAAGLPFGLGWPDRRIDQINLVTMCGLTLAGALLIVGLFSRLSALWAAAFLALIYLTNPAPPLGVGNPADPGHYVFVNKELVECLAALVLATIPTGRWFGLDALIRGLVTRRLSARFCGTPDDTMVKS